MLSVVSVPVVLYWDLSPVSKTDMFTMYSMMMPFCDLMEGGIQFIERVLESIGTSEMLFGGAEGTRRERREEGDGREGRIQEGGRERRRGRMRGKMREREQR